MSARGRPGRNASSPVGSSGAQALAGRITCSTPDGSSRRRSPLGWRVPILMYHRVVEEAIDPEEYYFAVTRQRFEQQMRCLKRLRFSVVGLEQVVAWVRGKEPLPPRPVAITFDDGYLDVYETAAPILERYGFRASLFLVSDHVGGTSVWDATPFRRPYRLLGWREARDLARRGFALGSHSRSHHDPTRLGSERLHDEITGSKHALEAGLGQRVRFFAYPGNRTNAQAQAAVRRAGYEGACAGDAQGYHPWCLDRVDPTHSSPALFLAKVSPWFYSVRRLRNRLLPPPTEG